MANTYTGENGADKALDRMIKHMDRNSGRGPAKKQTILSQLQDLYPDTWKEELNEMVREHNVPGYAEAKEAARAQFTKEYWSQPRWQLEGSGGELTYVKKALTRWREEWKG